MDQNTDNAPVEPLSMPDYAATSPSEPVHQQHGYQANGVTNVPISGAVAPARPQNIALPDPGGSAGSRSPSAQPGRQLLNMPLTQSHDDDLSIERDAIAKVMAVVHRTGTDPYLQSREIAKIKAEFLKRRYGKDLKLSEG